jgi:uncharacterized protein YoxC
MFLVSILIMAVAFILLVVFVPEPRNQNNSLSVQD